MNGSKGSHFGADEQTVAAVAKALSHPPRIAIVRLLAARTSCTTSELVTEFSLSQRTVSQHLKGLRGARLVESVPGNACECYALVPDRWAQVRHGAGQAAPRRSYCSGEVAAAGAQNACILSTVVRAERPTSISVAEANTVQLP